jgi:hypothetical protein
MKRCGACLRPYHECNCAKWCSECACRTNHTTAQHLEALRELPEEPTR